MNGIINRRDAVKAAILGTAGVVSSAAMPAPQRVFAEPAPASDELRIDITPRFELSPHLFMQFMEPLGTTDGSVEAAWDHRNDSWRDDVVETTRDLSPTMLRWGGIFTDFYRWREGVGPREKRPTMVNLMWGGLESNQVGTHEFIDFCRKIRAEPLMCVNFESDGRKQLSASESERPIRHGSRSSGLGCLLQRSQQCRAAPTRGRPSRFRSDYWQLGNETSYDSKGFDRSEAIQKTMNFPGRCGRSIPRSRSLLGEIQAGQKRCASGRANISTCSRSTICSIRIPGNQPVLAGERVSTRPCGNVGLSDAGLDDSMMRKIREVRQSLGKHQVPLAMTECHFTIPGRDRCDVMSTWATGVAYGRILNNHQRHGDVLKVATAADFCGTRWQVNAVIIPVPSGRAYLMPVARVMKLYRHHIGEEAVEVAAAPAELDVVASRTANKLFLHVVNTNRTTAINVKPSLSDGQIETATAFEIVDDPTVEVSELNSSEVMQIQERQLRQKGPWQFPPASVSAIEISFAA